MTPLAQAVLADSTLPLKKRRFADAGMLAKKVPDCHCFEVTAIVGLIDDLAKRSKGEGFEPDQRLAFLPAEHTWIEWKQDEMRLAVLLSKVPGRDEAEMGVVISGPGKLLSVGAKAVIPLVGNPERCDLRKQLQVNDILTPEQEASAGRVIRVYIPWTYALLAMINTPKIIGRQQHMPHLGLERRLAKARGMVGRFPLHAWTEIILKVGLPHDASGEGEHEGHLTGRRARHFVREHARIRNGRLEYVTQHWRGDPSIGIRRSRYIVRPDDRPDPRMA